MRQKLPDDAAAYGLYVNDIHRVVFPGDEFDAPHHVPGAVSLEPSEANGETPPPDDETAPPGDQDPQDHAATEAPRAGGRRRTSQGG